MNCINSTYEAKEGVVVLFLIRLSSGSSGSRSESLNNLFAAIFGEESDEIDLI